MKKRGRPPLTPAQRARQEIERLKARICYAGPVERWRIRKRMAALAAVVLLEIETKENENT